nr:BlaI/MecI/CopY family transcriptional regulator [uncultured Aminipila sp.]
MNKINNNIKRLGDAELEIMMILWCNAEPITSNCILDQIQGKRKWVLSTLMTSLARLAEKGFVHCDRKTRTNLYSALITENEYKTQESKTFLEKLYGNSLQSLITNLYSNKVIDHADLKELQEYLNQLELEKEKK